ncbi:MAG: helix-turn-helix transcriptional regulator [Magnetococcales bacterium]|nr:helix-turn-helix transcriptional regulator [Magnetococcales bacterium]
MSQPKSPNLMKAEYLDGYRLHLCWRHHGEDIVDLAPWIASTPALRLTFQDGALFKQAHVDEDGWSVAWNDRIELDAEHLFRLARYQTGESLEPESFHAWRIRHGLNQTQAAQALGITQRMVRYYEHGHYLVPKTITLACKSLDAMLPCNMDHPTNRPETLNPLTPAGTPPP